MWLVSAWNGTRGGALEQEVRRVLTYLRERCGATCWVSRRVKRLNVGQGWALGS